ncbi:MAG: hypothetical protein HYU63_07445 [Armatimonadetes bacterium]|nr:hypothetical protein [Armatimonadota bacterium]
MEKETQALEAVKEVFAKNQVLKLSKDKVYEEIDKSFSKLEKATSCARAKNTFKDYILDVITGGIAGAAIGGVFGPTEPLCMAQCGE